MKPRTRTLGAIGAIGATVVTTGLVLGLAFAGNSVASGSDQTTPSTVSMQMSQMSDMGSMMTGDSTGMAAMMGASDMSAMHQMMNQMMNQMMKGTVDDEVLAQCDKTHGAIAGSTTGTSDQGKTQHEAHHGGTGS